MTDGILLAETQGDPFLDQYDTIILDEAHERSLNIDFLIGYLKRLLPKRRDLKLIITSATIDAARFSAHFATPSGPAPVVEVSGRTFPVEVRWRPPMADEEGGEADLQQAVLAAVEEVAAIDRGDILIFMPTERHIHETAKTLRGRPLPGDPTGRETEILPLYGRLSIARAAAGLPTGRETPHRHRHERGRVVADRAADPLRDRSGHRPDQPLLAAEQDAAAADRGRFPRLGRPAQGPLRAGGAGHLPAAVCRAGLPGPRRLHGPGNPADQPGRRHSADQGPAARARSSGSRSSTRPSPRRCATATGRSSSSARWNQRAS